MLRAGFADPVGDSQACFRAVLDVMARPGTIHSVGGPADPPPPLGVATAAALLTLVDGDSPVWIDPAAAEAAGWIAFHCGAPSVPKAQAAFLLATSWPGLEGVEAGTDEGPENGATIILQLETLGDGASFTLEGPGLAVPTGFRAGLPPGFAADWAANTARFPRGVDLVLCAGDRLAALPRSVRIREG